MQGRSNRRRAYGTGSVFVKGGSWQGKWRVSGRSVKRSLGRVRKPGSTEGLTRKQAEARLRQLMLEYRAPDEDEVVTFEQAGLQHINRLEAMGRKRSTIEDYRSCFRIHLQPEFGPRDIASITHQDVDRLQQALLRKAAPKSVKNWMSVLSGIFTHAQKQRWIEVNPVGLVDKPKVDDDEEIRFLNHVELEALLRAVPDDHFGPVDRVLYLFAAMTGLRQGECLGLRWRHIDWPAMRVRVMKNYVRGEHTNSKSRKGRSVPLASRVAAELERHFKRSPYQGDNDLVFCNPRTGTPYDRSKLLKRFKAALGEAGIGEFEERTRKGGRVEVVPMLRFHDLRHTFGTTMAAAGVPARTLQEWMGHADIKTTQRYMHYAPSEREADLVDRAFAPQTDPSSLLDGSPDASEEASSRH